MEGNVDGGETNRVSVEKNRFISVNGFRYLGILTVDCLIYNYRIGRMVS